MSRYTTFIGAASSFALLASSALAQPQTATPSPSSVPEIVPVASAKATGEASGSQSGIVDLGADPSQPGGGPSALPIAPGANAPIVNSTRTTPISGANPPALRRDGQRSRSIKAKKSAALQADEGAQPPSSASSSTRPERVVFERAPVRVDLVVGQERRVVFPNPVALQPPRDAALDAQVIERTAYLTATDPMGRMRVIAEDLVTGQMVPVDLYTIAAPANKHAQGAGGAASTPTAELPEVQVFYKQDSTNQAFASHRSTNEGTDQDEADEPAAFDAVALTRYAAQMTYAPRRLLPSAPRVAQIPVRTEPVDGLLRGVRLAAVPLGEWRSGPLFVTAVRVTNLERRAVDLNLDEIRGSWTSATAQETHLLGAGSGAETSTLYLVCDRPFEACR